ncbi:hypothetical protein M758_8G080800 [Ceratodon purpureus]|nr:hypothetical protein M758_8G080800 [Ceratodon purpureus]
MGRRRSFRMLSASCWAIWCNCMSSVWIRNLERLPESLGLLTQLRELKLICCEKLEGLPDSVLGLTQLTLLEIGICTKLTLKEEVRYALTERGCEIRG